MKKDAFLTNKRQFRRNLQRLKASALQFSSHETKGSLDSFYISYCFTQSLEPLRTPYKDSHTLVFTTSCHL